MPPTLAAAALSVVMIGMRCDTAAPRMMTSSRRGLLPLGVLMMNAISPFLIMSSTCGRPSVSLKSFFTGTPAADSAAVRAARGVQVETEVDELLRQLHGFRLVGVLDADEQVAPLRQRRTGGHLRLGVGQPEVRVDAHDLAGRFHLRPEGDVHARETHEREHGFLHAKNVPG